MARSFIVILLVISLFALTSCTATEPTVTKIAATSVATAEATQEPTPEATAEPVVVEPTETVVNDFHELQSGTVVYAYHGGSGTILWDLDIDGVHEEIQFVFYDYDGVQVPSFELNLGDVNAFYGQGVYQCHITIGDMTLSIDGEEIEPIIMVVDVDRNDGQMELIVGDYGPSNDYFTTVVAYQEGVPTRVGYVPGIARGKLKINGSGVVTAPKRGNILHTWFYEAAYGYEGGELRQLQEDTYPMNCAVTLLQDLQLVMSLTDSTPADTLHTGDEAVIVKTDDIAWCYIETSDGRKGWFEVKNFGEVDGRFAYEIFGGLCFAD